MGLVLVLATLVTKPVSKPLIWRCSAQLRAAVMTAWSTRLAKPRYVGHASRAQCVIRRIAALKARIMGVSLVLATVVTKTTLMPLIWRLKRREIVSVCRCSWLPGDEVCMTAFRDRLPLF